MKPKRVVILGSTGSIGTSALKVARDIPGRMEVVGLAAGKNIKALEEQCAEFHPKKVSVSSAEDAAALRQKLPSDIQVVYGEQGLVDLAEMPGVDMVLVSIVGTAGLRPALAAAHAGRDLAIASKEILVMAGEAVMSTAREKNIRILPVDSEHNAIFQCLDCRPSSDVRRLLLTASGGPFRKTPASEFHSITREQALKHPTWSMGKKITLDSATLFNKGLEMIEAKWLFGIPMGQVEVVIHPQSIVHSMVEFVDHSVLAQLSKSDMCFPIQYAVTYPDRLPNSLEPLDFAKLASLTFEAPDPIRFPALRLAREAGERCGTLPAVLNAANEVAAQAFLEDCIPFPAIWEIVEAVMKGHKVTDSPSLDDLLQADQSARDAAERLLPSFRKKAHKG